MVFRVLPSHCHWLLMAMLCVGLAVSRGETQESTDVSGDQRLVFVTLDGLRWQEVFHGADRRLMNRDSGGVRDTEGLLTRFWSDDERVRREKLMPFLTKTVESEGQLWGNVDAGSIGRCRNGRYFSYPGYSEMIVGYADDNIDSNAKRHNENVSVFEWLNKRDTFAGQVAVFGSWDVFPFILNQPRSGVRVNAGWASFDAEGDPTLRQLNEWTEQLPRVWPGVRYDYLTFKAALHELRTAQPKVLWVALGETDDWAHDGRYDLYLDAAYRNDQYLKMLWETCQSLDGYRGKTTLVITVDHGRGDGAEGWKNHSKDLPGSEFIWVAAIGPEIPRDVPPVEQSFRQSQIAATLAQALGLDFTETDDRVDSPIEWRSTRQTD